LSYSVFWPQFRYTRLIVGPFTMANPESVQKPDIGTILDTKSPMADGQQSVTSNRPDSIRSAGSFQSAVSTLPETETETAVTTAPPSPPVTTGPTRAVLTGPSPKAKVPHTPVLTPQQQAMYAQVLSAVSAWKSIPESSLREAKNVEMTQDERMWLTRECLLRYLRATKWKVPDALKRLQSTLSWRREYGADTFTAEYISPENETGKQVIQGYDNEGRACLYLNPARQNTKMSDRQIHHLSYMLDRTIDMLPPGQETTCLLINFKGAAGGSIPTVGQAKAVLNILQNHNPERLGRALISDRKSGDIDVCLIIS